MRTGLRVRHGLRAPARVPTRSLARNRAPLKVSANLVSWIPWFKGSETMKVRPYTTRDGDSLKTIANKREMTVEQLLSINPDLKPDTKLVPGQTLLIPSDKISARDKEILDGIGPTYRIYPVRGGETTEDIILKRGITLEEITALNPGVDLKKLAENQLIKLPSNKFTVREREMLLGTGVLPPEFFAAAKNPFFVGGAVLMLVIGFVFAWMKFHRDPDEDEPTPIPPPVTKAPA